MNAETARQEAERELADIGESTHGHLDWSIGRNLTPATLLSM
jgi:hypothetical protein